MFALIIAMTLAVVYFISFVPLLDKLVAIKSQARIYMDLDDRGGALVSFLQTRKGDCNYAEIIGNTGAKGFPVAADADVKKSLERLEAELEVYRGGEMVRQYGEVAGYTATADIALPGLKRGEVKVS